jgi:hypothetical protein
MSSLRRLLAAATVVALIAAVAASSAASAVLQPAVPIESSGPAPSTPPYVGSAAKAVPFPGAGASDQNPWMAPNPTSNVNNDTWMSDDYPRYGGPLGRKPKVFSTSFGRTCITLTFDRKGRLIGSCISLGEGPALYMFDPRTLDILAFLQMPFVPPPAGSNPALNTTGGAYFFLDDRGRVVSATTDRRIFVVGEAVQDGAPVFRKVAEYDPRPCLQPGERMPSVLPDYRGRLWFVGREQGTIGVLDPKTGRCASRVLGEEIENSFAMARDGAYIVSDTAMYKLRAGADLKPRVVWSARYRNDGVMKTGQINAGSGTTPTLLAPGGGAAAAARVPTYVAVTDNADPIDVVVYRAADRLPAGRKRTVCQVPVFSKGASADENSLIAAGRSLFAENNSGYDLLKFNDVIGDGTRIGGDLGLVSAAGIARVDIAADGSGCRRAWTNRKVRPASVVSKGDSAGGVLYTYENARDPAVPGADPWNWAALDMRTGKVLWKRRAGFGGRYNNHYAGIAIGRGLDSRPTLYLGGVGGIMALRDG